MDRASGGPVHPADSGHHVVDGTHIDLQGSAFSNTYTSGGYVAGSIEDLGVSSPLKMSASASALRQDSDRQTNRRIAG